MMNLTFLGGATPVARRELRATRTATIAAIALGAAIAIGLALMARPTVRFELLSTSLARLALHGFAAALGLALAWLQVEDERRSDTWSGFLLLPLDRRLLVATKAAVGVACIAAAAGLPALGLAAFVALSHATGGPVDPVIFAAPLTVTLAGCATYFAGWIASLAPRPTAFGWARYLALGTGALAAVFAAASLVNGAVMIAAAVAPVLVLALTALRLAARPAGKKSVVERAAVAFTLAPVFTVALVVGATIVERAQRPTTGGPASTSYYTLDTNGDVLHLERDGRGRETAVPLGGSTPAYVAAFPERSETVLGLAPLDRRTFERRWAPVPYPTGALFYRASTRELALYGDDDGVLVGCLGSAGFTLPCEPLEGDLIDIAQLPNFGAVLIVTTAQVLRLEAPTTAPAELLRGDVRGAHFTGKGGLVLAVGIPERQGESEVVALLADAPSVAPSARCPLPDGGRVFAGLTRDGTFAMIAERPDGERTAIKCDRDGAVVSSVPMPKDPPWIAPSRDTLVRALAGPMPELALRVLEPKSPWSGLGPWLAAAVAGALAAGLAARSRGGALGAGLSALLAFTVGPGYVLAMLVIDGAELVRGARRERARIPPESAPAAAA